MINKRRTSKGTIRYQVRVGNVTVGTYDTLREARKAESKHHLSNAKSESMTVEQLCTRYLDLWSIGKVGKKPKAVTVARRRAEVNVIEEFFAARKIDTIRPTEAEDFCRAHVAASHAANAIFNYAVSRKLLAHNEFTQFAPKPGDGRKKLDPLTDAQIHQLQEVVTGLWGIRMGAMVPFWAYFGGRSEDVYGLDWSDIDWQAGEIHIRDGKTGPRDALLLDPAREAIESFKGIGPVFTLPISGKRLTNKNMSATYTPEVRKHFNPHPPRPFDWYELRHFNAHLLYVRMDVPAPIVAAHLGNSPEQIERRYGHYKVGALDRLREAVKHGIPDTTRDEGRAKVAHMAENTA